MTALEAPLELPSPATPEAADLGALVDLDATNGLEARDFPGRAALLAERESGGPERHLAVLRLGAPEPARPGAPVFVDGELGGACVVATYSAALVVPIALAYLTAEDLARPISIEIGGTLTPAEILRLPLLPARVVRPR